MESKESTKQARLVLNPASTEEVDVLFEQLKDSVFELLNSDSETGQRAVFCESGWLSPGRRYFYIKPRSQDGWLFERSGQGWIIAQCDKIVARDTFIRRGEAWDKITISRFRGAHCPRVNSHRLGDDSISFRHYEQQILQFLGHLLGRENHRALDSSL